MYPASFFLRGPLAYFQLLPCVLEALFPPCLKPEGCVCMWGGVPATYLHAAASWSPLPPASSPAGWGGVTASLCPLLLKGEHFLGLLPQRLKEFSWCCGGREPAGDPGVEFHLSSSLDTALCPLPAGHWPPLCCTASPGHGLCCGSPEQLLCVCLSICPSACLLDFPPTQSRGDPPAEVRSG